MEEESLTTDISAGISADLSAAYIRDFFTQPIDRSDSGAEKYDLREQLFGRADVLPMWVADQDLPTPPFIIEALQRRLMHPILGYTHTSDRLCASVVNWQAQYGYEVDPASLVFTHNVANGLFLAVQALSRPGEGVVIMPPIYPPFEQAISRNDRQVVAMPLLYQPDGDHLSNPQASKATDSSDSYRFDLAGLAQAFARDDVSLCLMCNPHNPSGRVWSRAELAQLAELALAHDVILVSDEIHGDLTLPPNQHCPLASLSPTVAQQTVTLSSPGKTFNLAGLQIGYAIAANPAHRNALQAAAARVKIDELNLFAMVALEAAYTDDGKIWRDALCQHILTNIARLRQALAELCPAVRVIQPQASYLVWLDFNPLIPNQFADHAALQAWLINDAKLGLNNGLSYGEVGQGFMRINLAVPPSTLEQACSQLRKAFGITLTRTDDD